MFSILKTACDRIKHTACFSFLLIWWVSTSDLIAQVQDTAYIAILNQFHTVLQAANTSQSNGTAIITGERSFVIQSLQAQQRWYYDNATQTIRLLANPGKCMARKGQQFVGDPIILTDVLPTSDPNSARQRWILEERRFKLAADKTVCIGLLNPNYNNGNTAVLTEVSNLGIYQQWYLRNKPSGMLAADGQLHRVNSPGNTYVDLVIPDPCPYPYLNIRARGGDGGIRSVHNIITNKEDLKARGGEGALMYSTYKIGTAPGELKPGTSLRFVVGRAGDSHRNDGGVVGASGGGGTGVLYETAGTTRPSGFSYYPWEVMLIAGGGGGGYSDCCASREDGFPANNDTPVLLNYSAPLEEYNGWCEKDGEQRKVNFGSGFRADADPAAGCRNGDGAGFKVTGWQTAEPLGGFNSHNGHSGGYGFGGGGANSTDVIALLPVATSGSGGGYNGCRNGSLAGGGGGSYVNSSWTVPFSAGGIKNAVTASPSDGFVEYQFTNSAGVVTRDLGFHYNKSTEASVLKTGDWTLRWQSDGNLVLYQAGVGAKWASNTNTKGTDIYFQGDGNLVIRQNSDAVWASATANDQHGGKGGRKLVLTSDGHLFIADQDGKKIWTGR